MKLLLIDLENDEGFARRLSLFVSKSSREIHVERVTLASYIARLHDASLAGVLINNDEFSPTVSNICASLTRMSRHLPVFFSISRGCMDPMLQERARVLGVVQIFAYEYYLLESDVHAIVDYLREGRVRHLSGGESLRALFKGTVDGLLTLRLHFHLPGRGFVNLYFQEGVLLHAELISFDLTVEQSGLQAVATLLGWEQEAICYLTAPRLLPLHGNIDQGLGGLLTQAEERDRRPLSEFSESSPTKDLDMSHAVRDGGAKDGNFGPMERPGEAFARARLLKTGESVVEESRGEPGGEQLAAESVRFLDAFTCMGTQLGLGAPMAFDLHSRKGETMRVRRRGDELLMVRTASSGGGDDHE